METELKLLIDEDKLKIIQTLPLLERVTVGPPLVQHLRNVYFDAPGFDLGRAGAGLRVRRSDGLYVQTLKAGGGVTSGLHQREEWETDVAGEKPDLDALRKVLGRKSAYASLIASPTLASQLQPVFMSNVERTVWQLRLQTGDEIEMAIDHGTIEWERNKETISEIELELKSGVAVHLYAFALELLEFVPLRTGTLSKAARGYAMRLPEKKKAVKATELRLKASMSVENAFEAIISNCMEQVQGNESGVMHGTDPESVHQMRVGLRRIRSALNLFSDVIACPANIQNDLKWIASQLGMARDWEVLAGSTLSHVKAVVKDGVNIEALRAVALERARVNREKAARALTSPRHTRLQLQFAEWIAGKQWRLSQPKQQTWQIDLPLKQFANGVLKRGEDRLVKRGKRLRENEPAARHRVRIAGKKVRYATEFFGSLYPRGKVKNYVARLSALQEQLGWLNDAAVAVARLAQLQDTNTDAATSAAFARGYLLAAVQADNPMLARAWQKFKKADVPYAH